MTASPRRFILTNQMNLNGMLSSRIIGPRQSFGKYYQDLLELANGFVPLLAASPSPELVDFVSAKTPTSPALLELAPAAPESRQLAAVTLTNAIPLSAVTAIHLPDERAAREHRARRYKNVHPHDDLLTVSPDLFDGTITLTDIRGARETTPKPAPELDWNRLDRIRGAMSASVYGATSSRSLRAAADLLPNGRTSEGFVGRLLRSDKPLDPDSTEDALLAAVMQVLIATDVRRSWNPQEVVSSVREAVHAGPSSHIDLSEVDSNLETVNAVITNQRSFTPFRGPTHGLRAAKALLLVLLREDLQSLAAWEPEQTGADDLTMQLAAVLAGALRGLSRESISTRFAVVDDHTAAWICADTNSGQLADVQVSHTDGAAQLRIGDVAVRRAPLTLSEFFTAMSQTDRVAALPRLAGLLHSDDAITLIVTTTRSWAQVTQEGAMTIGFPATATITYDYDLARLTDELDQLSREQDDRARDILGGGEDRSSAN